MSLRFMQIFLPGTPASEFADLLNGKDVLGCWRDDTVNDRVAFHLLVPADETEPIMDRLETLYGRQQGFRVVLFPVEAVLPRFQEKETAKQEGETQLDEQQKARESQRVSREELYHDVSETLGITRVFLAMTALSAIVAAVGLLRNDVAVVIGAMVIAPLLGPNVALSFATTLGDMSLLRRAILTNVAGVVTALGLALVLGLLLTVDPSVPAISNRTRVNLADIFLALAAGSAGTFAFTRGLSGAVIGVMVAVALVPPLVVFGMLLGSGHTIAALGALLLTAANVICINLSGIATFLAQGVRPRTWWEEKRAKRATLIASITWAVLLAALTLILLFSKTGI